MCEERAEGLAETVRTRKNEQLRNCGDRTDARRGSLVGAMVGVVVLNFLGLDCGDIQFALETIETQVLCSQTNCPTVVFAIDA